MNLVHEIISNCPFCGFDESEKNQFTKKVWFKKFKGVKKIGKYGKNKIKVNFYFV